MYRSMTQEGNLKKAQYFFINNNENIKTIIIIQEKNVNTMLNTNLQVVELILWNFHFLFQILHRLFDFCAQLSHVQTGGHIHAGIKIIFPPISIRISIYNEISISALDCTSWGGLCGPDRRAHDSFLVRMKNGDDLPLRLCSLLPFAVHCIRCRHIPALLRSLLLPLLMVPLRYKQHFNTSLSKLHKTLIENRILTINNFTKWHE